MIDQYDTSEELPSLLIAEMTPQQERDLDEGSKIRITISIGTFDIQMKDSGQHYFYEIEEIV